MPATWLQILFWWSLFAATHIAMSSLRYRPRLVRRLGEAGFQGVYSLVALAVFVPLSWTYFAGRGEGPWLWHLRADPLVHWTTWAASLAAWTLAIAALIQPSPVGADPRADRQASGVSRITRHGMLMGFTLWSLAHILLNGDAPSVAYFGGFAAYSIIGALHQDQRKRATRPDLADFFARTSIVPFAAIVSGRNQLVLSELPWVILVVSAALAYAIYAAHPYLFGA